MSSLTTTSKKVEEKKEPSFGKFLGFLIVSTLAVIIYFGLGAVFLEYAKFYSIYKMNGRFADKPPYTTIFPYVNMFSKEDPDDQNLIYRIFHWITKGLIYSFSSGRYMLDAIFDYSGKTIKKGSDIVSSIVMVFAPLLLIVMTIGSFFVGTFNTLIGLIENGGLIIPTFEELILLALPLMIPLFIYPGIIITTAFITSGSVGVVQTAMLLGFLLLVPLINKDTRQGVTNRMVDNKYLILLALSIFTTVSAFISLDKTYGYVTLGMSFAALIVFIAMRVL
jgi:hypothetical protein